MQILIISGVSGSGKTTVGSLLAQELGWIFLDADDFHPPENREKMRQGIPLTDADRHGWLLRLAALIQTHLRDHRPVVLACSALKEHYRKLLQGSAPEAIGWVFLHGSPAELEARLQRRTHAFMNPSLLASQLAALEAPQDPATLQLQISTPPPDLVQQIRQHFRL
ncbi:MAG: gluconokinase [Thermostichus sp. BF3_bins_97]